MTIEEFWEEFENQLIRETRTSMTMSFDESERMTKLGIKETVEKFKKRLEQYPCEDAVSREAVLDIIKFEENWLFDAKSNNADTNIAFSAIMNQVKNLSSVTPAHKKGKK